MAHRTEPPFRADHVGSLCGRESARRACCSGRCTDDHRRATPDRGRGDSRRPLCRSRSGCARRPTASFGARPGTWTSSISCRAFASTDEQDRGALPQRRRLPRLQVRRAASSTARSASTTRSSARPSSSLSPTVVHRDAEADHPVAQHGALPRGSGAIDKNVYPDEEEFWSDLSAAYASQVEQLVALGCTYLQLDDTSLAYLNDPAQRAELADKGADAEHQHERYIRQINAAISGRPPGLHVTTHLCRGNYRSSWAAEGGYDFVAEALFGQLDVDGFFLEYDDERSGGFEPLRFVPPGKQVVLGLVTTEATAAREQGRPQATYRRGCEVRAARSALPVRAVRVLVHRGGQRR